MRAFWEHGASTAKQVILQLADITNWKPKTIKTLLGRLVNKGALGYQKEPDSRGYVYHSLVTEADCVRAESRSFLQKVFGGAVSTAVINFLGEQRLTTEEIEQLRTLLDRKREEVELALQPVVIGGSQAGVPTPIVVLEED